VDNPKISILIPAYNCAKFIRQCLSSILNQTYSNFEILISDDGSTDNTRAIIDGIDDKRIRRFHNNKNLGKNFICNSLFQNVKGDYVSVHDADDFSHPKRFEMLLQFMELNTDYVMCGSSYYSVDEDGINVIERNKMETSATIIKHNIRNESQFHGPTLLFKRDIVPLVGGLYRYFTFGEDIDFTMRVVEKYKTCNLPQLLYFYRICSNSITKSVTNFSLERAVTNKLRYFLADQRKLQGHDCLMLGDNKEIEIEKRRLISELDNYQVIEDSVAYLLHYSMHKQAIMLCIKSFYSNVRIMKIFGLILYTFRKTFLFFAKKSLGFINYEKVDFSTDTGI
jgi:glycosyltransferase involved in cell wall biosynthesis